MFPSDPEYTRRLDAWNQAGSSPSLLVRDSSHTKKNGAALPRQPLSIGCGLGVSFRLHLTSFNMLTIRTCYQHFGC